MSESNPAESFDCFATATELVERYTAANSSYDTLWRAYENFDITSQADVNALSDCKELHGNVKLLGNDIRDIRFPGLKIIDGNLVVSSRGNLSKISAPDLESIRGEFLLSNLPALTHLEMPALSSVRDINWDALPVIQSPKFNTPHSWLGAMSIILSNTSLSDISFFSSAKGHSLHEIRITNNPQLNHIELSGLSYIQDYMEIANNGPKAQILLPHLIRTANTTLKNAINISVPVLEEFMGFFNLTNNDFPVFSAPGLVTIGSYQCGSKPEPGCGTFRVSENSFTDLLMESVTILNNNAIIEGNPRLKNITFKSLSRFDMDYPQSFTIANNPALETLIFPLLYSSGGISLAGNFRNISMPKLTRMRETFHINSSSGSLDCSFFDKLRYSQLNSIDAMYGYVNGSASSYSCGSFLPGTTKDVAKHWKAPFKLTGPARSAIIAVSAVIGVALFVLAIWLRRRWRKKHPIPEQVNGRVEQDVDLQDLNGLPPYRRVAKPGEVPPRYREVHEGSDMNAESLPSVDALASLVYRPDQETENHSSARG